MSTTPSMTKHELESSNCSPNTGRGCQVYQMRASVTWNTSRADQQASSQESYNSKTKVHGL